MVQRAGNHTGRAAVLRGPYNGDYVIETKITSKEISSLDVLVHLQVSGVCSGDLHSRNGGFPAPEIPLRPLVGGHEGVGTILQLGSDVERVAGLKVGNIVGLGWRNSTCDKMVNGLHTDGTFQEYIVAPALHVVLIPEGLDPVAAAPLLCGGATVLAALRSGCVSIGEWIAISGAAGGLGHLATQYAKAMGAHVVAIDGPQPEKEAFCASLGADVYIDFSQVQDVPAAVMRASNGGVHAALILNSHGSSYVQAFRYCRPLGRVIGLVATNLDFHLGLMFAKSLSLQTQTNGRRLDISDALAMAAEGKVKPYTEILKLEDVNTALDRIQAGDVKGRLVLSMS
ncbi:Adh2p [Fusarium denticulatum]|uniref:Adh2p n=1 Tax=Fusarium denticulatum TaxID=48507 RepID=A0A8H5T1T4_9HYPO|nr:Adh2p [Fusarium denticulatum]